MRHERQLCARGTFAVYDKRTRTEAALKGGADLVLELPTAYATRSAEGFARAGVQLLEATGVVERLAFGTECADLQALTALAGEIKAHQGEIAQVMKTGCSYPAARRKVIDSPLLDTPNNILALEYMECTQLPCTCVRAGAGARHDGPAVQCLSDSRHSPGRGNLQYRALPAGGAGGTAPYGSSGLGRH